MINDRPIENHAKDLYNRKSYAEKLADTLLAIPRGETLCVALTGPWGSGKTSTINLIKQYILSKKDDIEPRTAILSFEPWNFTTPEQLISQFFIQLAEHFGIDNKQKDSIGQCIIDYASKIEIPFIFSALSAGNPGIALGANLVKTSLVRGGYLLKSKSFTTQSIQSQKNKLWESLSESQEKLIIIIDDIDRLSDDQIRSVFQLVTIICKFPNIIYLLSFDKNVVAKALDRYQHNKGYEFLDKVVQIPLNIPRMNKNMLSTTLSTHLNELRKIYNIQHVDTEKWRLLYEYCVQNLIKTHRDVVRLRNELDTKLPLLANEVDFVDLVILTIIEQQEPNLYNWIELHEHLLTGQITYESVEDHGIEKADKKRRKDKTKDELSQIILHKDVFSPSLALEVLCIIFPRFSESIGGHYSNYDEDTARVNNNLCHRTKFGRYFSYALDQDQISNIEVMFMIDIASKNEIQECIYSKDKQGLSIELFDELKSHLPIVQANRIPLLIQCICNIGDMLNAYSSNGLFDRIASDEAIRIINVMLLSLAQERRYQIVKDRIEELWKTNLNTVSGIMNCLKKANGIETPSSEQYAKYPALLPGEYENLEALYIKKVKTIIPEIDPVYLLDKNAFIFYYKQFPQGHDDVCSFILSSPVCIIKYVAKVSDHWKSSGTIKEIGITEAYKEFVTESQVENAIESIINAKKFSTLELDSQRVAVAFLMRHETLYMDWKTIDVTEIDKRIEEISYSEVK